MCPHRCNQRHGVCRNFGPQPSAAAESSAPNTTAAVSTLDGSAAVSTLDGSVVVASGTLEGSAAREVLGHCLDTADLLLAHTAFAGRAVFARLAAIQHQSSQHSDREENVEVRFDGNSSPIAAVYACRDIHRDEMFIM